MCPAQLKICASRRDAHADTGDDRYAGVGNVRGIGLRDHRHGYRGRIGDGRWWRVKASGGNGAVGGVAAGNAIDLPGDVRVRGAGGGLCKLLGRAKSDIDVERTERHINDWCCGAASPAATGGERNNERKKNEESCPHGCPFSEAAAQQ